MTTFQIHALPDGVLATVRANRTDLTGSSPAAVVIADGGEPVRCCLRDAQAGDELLLFNYEPPLPESPYREMGAVFIHAAPCAEPAPAQSANGPSDYPADYPADWIGRPQVLRAYDERGWIHSATTTHDGTDPVSAIRAVLAAPGVVQVHSRNIAYGCYMFAITPTTGTPPTTPV